MIQELSAEEMDAMERVVVSLKTDDMQGAAKVLQKKFPVVKSEEEYIRVYDVEDTEEIVKILLQSGYVVSEIQKNKIGLEEYYIELMSKKEGA